MKPKIRPAEAADLPVIAGFQLQMALETEALHLNEVVLRAGVEALFNDPSKGRYFVAQTSDEIAGSLLITYEWSDWRNQSVWWIQSVFVKSEYRRKGIYTALYDYVKNLAINDDSVGGIRLYVDKTNLNAQATYRQLGMNGDHYQLFEWMKTF